MHRILRTRAYTRETSEKARFGSSSLLDLGDPIGLASPTNRETPPRHRPRHRLRLSVLCFSDRGGVHDRCIILLRTIRGRVVRRPRNPPCVRDFSYDTFVHVLPTESRHVVLVFSIRDSSIRTRLRARNDFRSLIEDAVDSSRDEILPRVEILRASTTKRL